MQIKQNIIIYTRTATVHCIRRFRLNRFCSPCTACMLLTIPTFRVNQLVKAIVDHEDTGPDWPRLSIHLRPTNATIAARNHTVGVGLHFE